MTQPALDLWQYRIGPAPEGAAPAGLDVGGGFRLEPGPGLPAHPVTGPDGAELGRLLGFPIDLAAARLVDGAWRAPGADPAAVIRALAGPFLYVARGAAGPELHPDALAQVPCVHEPETRRAAASAHALYDDDAYEARLDRPFLEAVNLVGEGWFPAGMTAHRGLRRLPPNHVLELATGEMRRVWDGPGPGAVPDPDAAVDEIVALGRAQLRALAEGPRRVAVALTAGVDSRSVLAMARGVVPEFDCVTVVAGDRHARDTVIARRIAQGEGLPHLELPRVTATAEEQALFLRRSGHCHGDSNRLYHPSVRPLAAGHVFVGGMAGEIARGPYWAAGDTDATALSGRDLVARFGLAPVPRLIEAMEARLEGLPDLGTLRRLELIFLEDRLAPWASVQFPADPGFVRYTPFVTRRVVELMMGLPEEWRRAGRLPHEIVRRTWPELAGYPINTLGRARDGWLLLRRAVAEPWLVAQKLRKMRG